MSAEPPPRARDVWLRLGAALAAVAAAAISWIIVLVLLRAQLR